MFLANSMKSLADQLRSVLGETDSIKHAPTKGGIREARVRRLLAARLPRQYVVVSGVVTIVAGEQSLQQDFLLADALGARPFTEEDGVGIFPVELIAGCIEVKSRIERQEIRDGIQKAASVKGLSPMAKRSYMADMGDGVMAVRYTTNKPLGAIVGLSSERSLTALQDAFVEECLQVEPENRPNALFVLDKGAVFWSQEEGLSFELAPQAAKYSLLLTSPDLENALMLFYGYVHEFLRSYALPSLSVIDYVRASEVPLDHRSVPISNYQSD